MNERTNVLGFELDMGDRLMRGSLSLQAAHMWSTGEADEQSQKLQLGFYEKNTHRVFGRIEKGSPRVRKKEGIPRRGNSLLESKRAGNGRSTGRLWGWRHQQDRQWLVSQLRTLGF